MAIGHLRREAGNSSNLTGLCTACSQLSRHYRYHVNSQVPKKLQLGVRAQQNGDLARAEGFYREVLLSEPRNADALQLLGVFLFQSGQRKYGLNCVRRAIHMRPFVAGLHLKYGNALLEGGAYRDALGAYQGAVALAPADPDLHFNIGRAHRRGGAVQLAEVGLRKAIHSRAGFTDAVTELAALRGEQSCLGEADNLLDQSLAAGGAFRVRVRRALVLPPIPSLSEQIVQARVQLDARVGELRADGITISDALAAVGTTQFYLSYPGRSNQQLHQAGANFYLGACYALRALNTLAYYERPETVDMSGARAEACIAAYAYLYLFCARRRCSSCTRISMPSCCASSSRTRRRPSGLPAPVRLL